MRDMMRLCDLLSDEEWLVLVEALACFIEKRLNYKGTNDLFGKELEIAKNLMRKLYGR